MPADRIVIACAVDQSYFRHLAAMMASVIKNTEAKVDFFLMHADDVKPEGIQRMAAWLNQQGHELQAVQLAQTELAGLLATSRFPAVIWARIMLPSLLPKADRVIYLDADLLVRSDIKGLWEQELDGCPIAGVADPLYYLPRENYPYDIGIKDPKTYFNSGVLLMNLAAMRAAGSDAEMLAFGKANSDWFRFPDQETLNLCFQGKTYLLSPQWNALSALLMHGSGEKVYSAEEMKQTLANPLIVHFEGPLHHKPWHAECPHPYRQEYAEYRKLTPWPRFIPKGLFRYRLIRQTLGTLWRRFFRSPT